MIKQILMVSFIVTCRTAKNIHLYTLYRRISLYYNINTNNFTLISQHLFTTMVNGSLE